MWAWVCVSLHAYVHERNRVWVIKGTVTHFTLFSSQLDYCRDGYDVAMLVILINRTDFVVTLFLVFFLVKLMNNCIFLLESYRWDFDYINSPLVKSSWSRSSHNDPPRHRLGLSRVGILFQSRSIGVRGSTRGRSRTYLIFAEMQRGAIVWMKQFLNQANQDWKAASFYQLLTGCNLSDFIINEEQSNLFFFVENLWGLFFWCFVIIC